MLVVVTWVDITLHSQTKVNMFSCVRYQTVRSRNLDYSHFISLPLAIHPELVSKLINFQNTILGNDDSCMNENVDADSNEGEDTTDNKEGDQLSKEIADVAVELKVADDSKSVKVNHTSIPLVSYAPKASKASPSSGMGTICFSMF